MKAYTERWNVIMGKVLLTTLLCLIPLGAVAQEASADEAPPPGEGLEAEEAPPPGDGLEFVDEGPSPFDNEEPMDLPDDQEEVDATPPSIDDFAVAAGSPDAPVRVTAVVTDDSSGIEAVEIFYRVGDQPEFSKVGLDQQSGGLFMGILPDGPQRTGFSYYAQARDAAGNVQILGDPIKPYKVAPARMSGIERLERSRNVVEKEPLVAPIWIAVPLGIGVISAVGAAVALGDIAKIWFFILPEAVTEADRQQAQQFAIVDAAVGGILGVVAVAALVTGTGLLIFAAFEE